MVEGRGKRNASEGIRILQAAIVERVSVCSFHESCFVAPKVIGWRSQNRSAGEGCLPIKREAEQQSTNSTYIYRRGGPSQRMLPVPWDFIVLMIEQESRRWAPRSSHSLVQACCRRGRRWAAVRRSPLPPRTALALADPPDLMTQNFTTGNKARHATGPQPSISAMQIMRLLISTT